MKYYKCKLTTISKSEVTKASTERTENTQLGGVLLSLVKYSLDPSTNHSQPLMIALCITIDLL